MSLSQDPDVPTLLDTTADNLQILTGALNAAADSFEVDVVTSVELTIDQITQDITIDQVVQDLSIGKIKPDITIDEITTDVSIGSIAGSMKIENGGGTVINPATKESVTNNQPRTIQTDNAGLAKDSTLTNVLSREISTWSAGTLDVNVQGSTSTQDAHNYGYDYGNTTWRELRVNTDGKLICIL